jgi:hypothetical protein
VRGRGGGTRPKRGPSHLDLSGLEVQHATSSAFKGIKGGQVAKSRRYSSDPHDLSAAWAKRRCWRVFTRVFVVHGRKRSLNRNVARRQTGGSASASVAPPPSAHPMLELSGRRRAGGTCWTRRICRNARQCGKHEVTNKQTIWYRIRISSDDQHMGDLPRGYAHNQKIYAGRTGSMRK